jgi:hypothetical protein
MRSSTSVSALKMRIGVRLPALRSTSMMARPSMSPGSIRSMMITS